jgi:Ca-activated chloride channel family protein
MGIRLADKIWLLGLLLVPLAGFAVYWLEKRLASALFFPGLSIADNPIPGAPQGSSHGKGQGPLALSKAIRLLVLALLIVACARPQWVKSQSKVFSEGIDIVLTLDISTSMNAADFQPRDRITVAKEVVSDFISHRKNDRIGLVVFAKEAYTQSPLTLDYDALVKVAGTLRTGMVEDGTAIGNAIATATNRLRAATGKGRVLVLVTDGDSNAGNITPLEAADLAKQHGVRVFTILVGKEGPVPYPVGKDVFGRMRYENVEFSANPTLLRQIAERTGGKFYNATDGEQLKGDMQKILNEMEKTRYGESSSLEEVVELAPHAAMLALFLLIIDFIIGLSVARRFPW